MSDSHYEQKRSAFADQEHRAFVGGMWEEIGALQFDFLLSKGLKPEHKLLDVGCGSLRGGTRFIGYLNAFNYFGTDINEALIKKGLEEELAADKREKISIDNFRVSDDFDFGFETDKFDYAIAFSLFTHLSQNKILLCLQKIREKFDEGRVYATFFENTTDRFDTAAQQKDGITTYSYKDPYHYRVDQIDDMARRSGWSLNWIGDFNHPRNQKMAEFIPF